MKIERTENIHNVRVKIIGDPDAYPLLYFHPIGHPPDRLNHFPLLAKNNLVIAPNYYDIIAQTKTVNLKNVLKTITDLELEEHIGVKIKAVVGCSIGGALAISLAQRKVDLDFCIAASPSGMPLDRTLFDWITQFLLMHIKSLKVPANKRKNNAGSEMIIPELVKHPQAVLSGLNFARQLDLQPILAEIKVPTTILLAANDNFVPESVGLNLANQLPNAQAEIVSHYGHLWYMYQPEIIIDWVEKLKKESAKMQS